MRFFRNYGPAGSEVTSQRRSLILVLACVAGLMLLWLTDPLSQSQDYHLFADSRTLIGLANALNVLTNLPFLLVGGLGLIVLSCRPKLRPPLAGIYRVFLAGLILVGLGSGWYHLNPDNDSLFWDRLPMAVCFASFAAIVVAEGVGKSAGLRLFAWLLPLALGSVQYWQWLDDLRLYLLVQFGPVLVLPLILLRSTGGGTPWFWLTLVCYGLAKALELNDGLLFDLSRGWVSGHSLKHLVAALGALMLVIRLCRMREAAPRQQAGGETSGGLINPTIK